MVVVVAAVAVVAVVAAALSQQHFNKRDLSSSLFT